MNQEKKGFGVEPLVIGPSIPLLPKHDRPYRLSRVGKYARILLLLAAFPLLIWSATYAFQQTKGILCLVSTAILLTSLITHRGRQGIRVTLLVAMTLNVFALAINPNDVTRNHVVTPELIGTRIILLCLVIACIFEMSAWIKGCSRTTILKTLGWGTLAIPAIIYIFAVPLVETIWETVEADKNKLLLRDPNWNVINEATFRAAKFGVFLVFAYLGACVGSFLNVVAYCIPRREPIGLRDSRCPTCHIKISRIDNLPIFSYINLGARCRSCKQPIPARYLIVELVVATLFGSLFLYELTTGGQNVPDLGVVHKGILWVILYPKWPAILIYCFHVFFMSAVLILCLFEWDKQRLKPIFASILGIVFFLSAAIYLPLQPVPLLDHLPVPSLNLSLPIQQLLKLTIGSLSGWAVGWLFGSLFKADPRSILAFGFLLTGMVLGWQALLQVVVVFAFTSGSIRLSHRLTKLLEPCPTTILLFAIAIHHPFWATIANLWRFS